MKYTCPCCGYKTLDEPPGSYLMCKICFWEDDDIQNKDPLYRGGANRVSLYEAQQNFIKYGVCELRFIDNVRSPNATDTKDIDWVAYERKDDRLDKITIDLKSVNTAEQLHKTLKEELGFPDFYGMNWDAFWDAITGIVEMPKSIDFIGWYDFELRLFKESRMLKSLFEDLETEYPFNSSRMKYYDYE